MDTPQDSPAGQPSCEELQRQLEVVTAREAHWRAEARKWEKEFDDATDRLEFELLRDNYGPLETYDQCVKRLAADARRLQTLTVAANQARGLLANLDRSAHPDIEQVSSALRKALHPADE